MLRPEVTHHDWEFFSIRFPTNLQLLLFEPVLSVRDLSPKDRENQFRLRQICAGDFEDVLREDSKVGEFAWVQST